jgi:hypothetical protein
MARRSEGEGTAQVLEKRRSQRIRLYSPIHAEIDGVRAALVDLSADGACVEAPLAVAVGGPLVLTLTYQGVTLFLDCSVVRCRLDRSVQRDAIIYNTGLQFTAESETISQLRAMLNAVTSEDLDARRDYARPPRNRR